jgi:NADH-quinone oxidoreductase subunit H
MIGCLRAGVQVIGYEVLTSIVLLHIFLISGTTNFESLSDLQESAPVILFLPTIGIISFFAVLMETNRPPFDLSEAESDVVAGYVVEYSGVVFGLFYLGEYLNLFTNSVILSIVFLGSW